MGKLRTNKAVGDLQGKVGGLIYAHQASGTVVVRRAPEQVQASTVNQQASQARFILAQRYFRMLKANPELYAPYKAAAAAARRRACDMAIADFLRPPELKDVDLTGYSGKAGEAIRVEAVDDFDIASVTLVVSTLDGAVIEQGPAARNVHPNWVYTAQTAIQPGNTVIIQVRVADRPGNTVTKLFHHAITA